MKVPLILRTLWAEGGCKPLYAALPVAVRPQINARAWLQQVQHVRHLCHLRLLRSVPSPAELKKILTPRRKAAKSLIFQRPTLSYLCALAPLREIFSSFHQDPSSIFDIFATFDIFDSTNPQNPSKPDEPETVRSRTVRRLNLEHSSASSTPLPSLPSSITQHLYHLRRLRSVPSPAELKKILTQRRQAAKSLMFQRPTLSYLCALATLREIFSSFHQDPSSIFDIFTTFDIFDSTNSQSRRTRRSGTLRSPAHPEFGRTLRFRGPINLFALLAPFEFFRLVYSLLSTTQLSRRQA